MNTKKRSLGQRILTLLLCAIMLTGNLGMPHSVLGATKTESPEVGKAEFVSPFNRQGKALAQGEENEVLEEVVQEEETKEISPVTEETSLPEEIPLETPPPVEEQEMLPPNKIEPPVAEETPQALNPWVYLNPKAE